MRTILNTSASFVLFFFCFTGLKAQTETRKFGILITNEQKKAVVNADVELVDNFGKVLKSKTNNEGIANFDIGPVENYSSGRARITRGVNTFDSPVFINYRLKMLTIEMPEDMVIITDGWDDNKITELKEPTINTKVSTDKSIYSTIKFSESIPFGPYTALCEVNPLASVPTYDKNAIESEKTLLDAISESCLGAADEAVNSLVDLTFSTVGIKNKLQAIFEEEMMKGKLSSVQKSVESLKNEDGPKIKAAIENAIEKTKGLYEVMEKIAAGPELYIISCMWDGIVKYYVPEGILKVKKAAESFGKAKEAMSNKIAALKDRYAKYDSLQMKDKELLTNWSDITENIKKTSEGLNILLGYVKNPRKAFTSYESQAKNALSLAESMINKVTDDCKIIDLDQKMKEGIEAAQAALTSKRKFAAQMGKEEGKWKDKINEISGTKPWYPFGQEDVVWPANAMAPLIGIESQWVQLVPYHNERVNAQKDVERITNLLSKLAEMCRRTQSASEIINQKIEKYEQLYVKGCEAADKCDFSNAFIIVSQLREQERSACGHFYPRPFGFIKSENLKNRIERNKQNCKTGDPEDEPIDPSWVSTVLYKIYPECANKNDPRNTIEDVLVSMYFDGKKINATGPAGFTMFPAGPHTMQIEIGPREGYPSNNSSYIIKRVEWMRCAGGVYGEDPVMNRSTPNAKEVTMKVNIVKNQDKNHCYKAVIYVDKCAGNQ